MGNESLEQIQELQERIDELEGELETNPRAGKEAEEIRKALEGIRPEIDAVIDSTDTTVLSDALEKVADQIEEILEEVDARDSLAYLEERTELRELVLELFQQACATHPTGSDDPIKSPQYDHSCMSTYEDVQRKLIEWGMIKQEDCVRQ
jgi:phage shock protein A